MYIVKGNRVGDLRDISRTKIISVTKKISKERVKRGMGKPKGNSLGITVLWIYGHIR